MTNILITGINYWPEPTGIAPYTTQFAEHFVTLGHHVTVITGVPHYPRWVIDRAYVDGPREQFRAGVRIIRRRHYVPRHQSVAHRLIYEASFLAAGLTARPTARPDVVIGITPSLSGAALARLFARRFRVRYGVVVQDLMGPAAEQSGISAGRRISRVARLFERATLSRADAIAVVSQAFVPYLETLGLRRDRLTHLPNWSHVAPSTRDPRETRRSLGWDDRTQVVLHGGNMGLKQGLEQVIIAARVAARQGLPIRFVLMGDGSQRVLLEEQAKHLANVSFLDVQPESSFADILSAADVLLLSERQSVVDMSLPSKLTSYFSAGRPVVAAVSPSGATAAEVARADAGLVVAPGDPEALLAAILRLRADSALSTELAGCGRAYASTSLGREAALHRAEGFLDQLGGSRRRVANNLVTSA